MAEGEIAILIKLVDEMSGKLKNIEQNVEQLGSKTEKTNKNLADSFTKVQGAMLNLGQVAQGVHNIFETYQNRTRTLENAQDRLENANIRLKKSFQDVAAAEKKLIDIEKDHIRDALTLERAQLRLKEAQYELNEMVVNGVTGGFAYEEQLLAVKEAEMDVIDAQDLSKQKTQEIVEANQQLRDAQDNIIISTNNVERAQRGLEKATGDLKWSYLDMGVQTLSVAGNLSVLLKNIGPLIGEGGFGGLLTKGRATALMIGAPEGGLIVLFGALSVAVYAHAKSIQAAAQAYDELGKDMDDVMAKTTGMRGTRITEMPANVPKGTKIDLGPGGIPTTTKKTEIKPSANLSKLLGSSKKVKDAIIRPNGQIIETDPRDTLIATQNPGGMGGPSEIVVKIDSEVIDRILLSKFNKKVTV